jgi:hypothetical protein
MRIPQLTLAVGAMLIAAIGPGEAQTTTQNGPYYATPSWDQQIPTAQRFVVLANWNSEAVLDRETGLVWQRTPATDETVWASALRDCHLAATGNRLGWRLPSVEEMLSLLDPATNDLPAGHPFSVAPTVSVLWTASTDETFTTDAYIVVLAEFNSSGSKTNVTFNRWCVRGGSAVSNPF